MEYKHFHDTTPSSGTNHLVEKVRNGAIKCDSPFRLLPNFSTPPSRVFKIRNPFESPLLERLHLPVCSPGLFAKSTPKRDEQFIWSICDISHLKPAEIDTNYYQETIHTTVDPQTESVIQDKISTFFRLNAVVPSPAPRETNGIPQDNGSQKPDSLAIKKSSTVVYSIPMVPQSMPGVEMDIHETSEHEAQYLSEEAYYKKLFEFGSQVADTSPSISPLDSPVQFSPPQKLEVKSDEMDKKSFDDCILSPITPENEMSRNDHSKNMSTRELKSVCRLVFSDKALANEREGSTSDLYREPSVEDTVTESESISNNISDGNFGIMSIDEVFQECENENMDISLIHTPKTGLFASPRKRLSDSFKDFHGSFRHTEEISECNTNNIITKSGFLPEGSSDLGYHSANIIARPSMTENTWSSSHVFSSTPTKRKN